MTCREFLYVKNPAWQSFRWYKRCYWLSLLEGVVATEVLLLQHFKMCMRQSWWAKTGKQRKCDIFLSCWVVAPSSLLWKHEPSTLSCLTSAHPANLYRCWAIWDNAFVYTAADERYTPRLLISLHVKHETTRKKESEMQCREIPGSLTCRDGKAMYYLRTSGKPGKEIKSHGFFSQERGKKSKAL